VNGQVAGLVVLLAWKYTEICDEYLMYLVC